MYPNAQGIVVGAVEGVYPHSSSLSLVSAGGLDGWKQTQHHVKKIYIHTFPLHSVTQYMELKLCDGVFMSVTLFLTPLTSLSLLLRLHLSV